MTVKEQSKEIKSEVKKEIKKGLKKGTLEFLLSGSGFNTKEDFTSFNKELNNNTNSSNNKVSKEQKSDNNFGYKLLAIEKIERSPYQPRFHFDKASLEELASSIKAKGLIQPLVVRKRADQKYELIAGERRWRACQLAQLHEVPVVVKDVDNETALVMAIVENIQREDLNVLEEAKGLKRLLDEFALTQQQVAQVVGKSRTAVTNLLRLLSLNTEVQKMLAENKLEMGHARALLSLDDSNQLKLANRVIMRNASVRDTEKWVKEILKPNNLSKLDNPNLKRERDPNIRSLERDLSDVLNTEVIIEHTDSGRGRLLIKYFSIDELDGIVNKIN